MKNNISHDPEYVGDHFKEMGRFYHTRQRNRSCCDSVCCVCLPCCPVAVRWLCCIGLFIIVVAMVILGSLVALFKMPTVEYNGLVDNPSGSPRFKVDDALSSLAFEINLGFNLGIINPNIEYCHFEKITATAYYPHQVKSVGGGVLNDLTINPYSVTNVTFPFQIKYNPENDDLTGMLQDIVDRCGLSGFPVRDINVYYDLTPTVRLFGLFPLSITIRRQVNFPCPIDNGLFHGI